MKQFLVLFREPDGRKEKHSPQEIKQHRQHWDDWMKKVIEDKILLGGKPLTLQGSVIRDGKITGGPYTKGDDEIVGGYLLIQAEDLATATKTISTCPIFEFGGFAEVRECMA